MDTSYLSDLQKRFGLSGTVDFTERHGMPVVEVNNAQGSGVLALQGAQLLTWAPKDQAAVVWLSPQAKFACGKSARGGVPICWPWFGPHAEESAFPVHGFARTAAWEVIEVATLEGGANRLGFRLLRKDADDLLWPHCTPLEVRYTLGAALEIELGTRSRSPNPLVLGEALHTYFAVGDVREVRVLGLDGVEYIDKVDGGRRKRQAGPVTVGGEVDRVYLGTESTCLIEDLSLNRRIRIEKSGSRATVVWNPWEDKAAKLGDFAAGGHLKMLCVESANAADAAVVLGPGEEHRLWVRYSVEPLA
ncbi:D-hexose-6-phosphate mutarotase [Methylomagnum ishizawai]|uniref:D-hexose-6-phosphate mutarotase n=1 Tax=Methylomagnum ishizawai TaxID=1760988 RepID=UPI001C32CEEA|nr:D-hexose-6-phosphate mutarotase [Methylomagnum ishizawai]BBL73246.1 D-hexose-6-phosphate mutarotase [Methylomagnum ishizawai]